MIPEETIDQIRQATDIVQVISGYLRLKKRGKNYLAICPFHTEKTPSFSVSPDKQIFHCFGCGKGGNVFSFLMEHEKMPFIDVVRMLAKNANITIHEEKGTDLKRKVLERVTYTNNVAVEFFQKILTSAKYKSIVDKYLKQKRKINKEAIEYFQLGLAGEEWDGLIKYAAGRDLSPEDLVQAGLALKSEKTGKHFDRFRQRLMIPIINLSQKPIAFGGRTLKKGEPAKYINSPETSIYVKGNNLYGLNFAKDAIRETNEAYVVEGYFDVISLWQVGVKNVVASSGTSFTSQQARLLARFADKVYLFFDADSAGQQAALRSIDYLFNAGLDVKVIVPPEGEDPDSIALKYGREKIEDLKSNALDYIPYRMRDISLGNMGLIGKEKLVKELAALGDKISDPTRRSLFISSAADTLGIDPQMLRESSTTSTAQSQQIRNKQLDNNEEANLLSLLFATPGLIDSVLEKLSPEDFDSRKLARIYAAIVNQYRNKSAINIGTLIDNNDDEDFVSLVTAIASREWDADEIESNTNKALTALLAQKRKRIRTRLKQELTVAEAEGDHEKAERLMVEIRGYGLYD